MGMVKRKLRISSVVSLFNLITEGKGKGTTSMHDIKRIRKVLEACTVPPEGRPGFYKDPEIEKSFFAIDPNRPVFQCPKCEDGVIIMDKAAKTFEPCSRCKWESDEEDTFDPDWDEIGGYDRLKDEKGKNVKHVMIELPKRFIAGTIWTRILLPKLEGEHRLLEEDIIERICEDFSEDGLPQQFENVTTKDEKDDDDEDEKGKEKKPEPKLVSDEAAKAIEEKMIKDANEADRKQPEAQAVGKS